MRVPKLPRYLVIAAAVTAVVAAGAFTSPAAAAAPKPVYAPSGGVADPGVVRTNGNFYVFATGSRAPVHRGDVAAGPWTKIGPALSELPAWADNGAVWAPDAVQTPAGRVLYYSVPAKNFGGQRCIGVATASRVEGPYTPVGGAANNVPLICPGGRHGAEDPVPGRPVAGAGVIDPSPFQDAEGRRFVLYKTQQKPSSIRMLRVGSNGLHSVGNDSGELIRNSGIIENPVMVQRGSRFVLFASRYGYNNCSYATVYFTSANKWDFHGKTQHSLLTTGGTGICGPGGADVTPSLDGGWRIFLHGWLCGSSPCRQDASGNLPSGARRVLYAAILRWGSDGATPTVGAFL